MTRYIDADPLYDQIAEKEELARQRVLDTPTYYDGRVNPTYIRYSAQADERTNMRKMVMNAPTIDARVLRHGKWIHRGGGVFTCNKCCEDVGLNVYTGEKASERFKYCPNCGARMDEE